MPRIDFDMFSVTVPYGWEDITDAVEGDDPPYTLAHVDGVGALQFSIALFKGGQIPDPAPADLLAMVEEFGLEQGFESPVDVVTGTGPPILAAGSFTSEGDFVRVWQVSDGRSFAFITYTCAEEDVGSEVTACEKIVRSIVFGGE
jgi:hypothetical protein